MEIPSGIDEDLTELFCGAKPVPPELFGECHDLWRQQTNYGKSLLRKAPPVFLKDYPKLLGSRPNVRERDLVLRHLLSTSPDAAGYCYHGYLLNVPRPGSLFVVKTWPCRDDGKSSSRPKSDVACQAEIEALRLALKTARR